MGHYSGASSAQEPLLLLPGMMCDARLFSPQIEKFSQQRTVSVVPLTAADEISALAARVLRDAPPKFALAGLSMGGIVAMEVVRQAPQRVTKLALLDTNPLAETQERRLAREPQIEAVAAGGLRRVIREEMKPNYLCDGPSKGRLLKVCMEMAEALGAAVFIAQSKALQGRPDQCATLSNVVVPSLVLCGEQDQLCPVERHRLMADLLPNCRLVVVDKAAHMPTLEQPQQTNAALSDWLNA